MAPRVRDISACHELKDISEYHHEEVKRHLNVTTSWRRHLNITYVYISCHELNVSTYHEGRKTSTHIWQDFWISPRTQGDVWISLMSTYYITNSIYLHITNSRRHQHTLDETSEYRHEFKETSENHLGLHIISRTQYIYISRTEEDINTTWQDIWICSCSKTYNLINSFCSWVCDT